MTRYAFLALALPLVACGGSTSGLNTAEIQAFNTSAQGVSAAVATYETQAAAMTSPPACTSAQASYDSEVRPVVGRMQGMGADMDAMMGSMNHMDAEDMGCSANAMLAEMNRHQAIACASTTDMTPNKTEAQQHVAAMTQWASHAMGRSHDLASMAGMSTGGMMGSGSTTGRCIHNADGSYTLQP
jgi:Skp family chaperone for outer membrane proteins